MEMTIEILKFGQQLVRAAFGMAALELVKKYENLIILTCDVSTSAGFRQI